MVSLFWIIMEKIIPYKKIKFDFNNYQISVLEAMLSRGDRTISGVIHRVWQQGARFDAWSDFFDFDRWEQAIADSRISLQAFLNGSDPEVPLSWDHIDIGVDKKFLLSEFMHSRDSQTSFGCREKCMACGVQSKFQINCQTMRIRN